MYLKKKILLSFLFIVVGIFAFFFFKNSHKNFVSYTVDLQKQNLKFYWKDDKGNYFKSLGNLKNWVNENNKTLAFAMNGGMYKENNIPQGLFIEDGIEKATLDTLSGNGNFYLKPNAVFYITQNNIAGILDTKKILQLDTLKYATQSGPMLVIDGFIHPAFIEGSKNLNIRNGVGILPNNKVIFVMSKKEINFYDFAKYFKNLGCKNALYLDGFVSRTYLPKENWEQLEGDFGVIIGVVQ